MYGVGLLPTLPVCYTTMLVVIIVMHDFFVTGSYSQMHIHNGLICYNCEVHTTN